jgi:hypothetical protein
MSEEITAEEFGEAINTLHHQPAFKTYIQGLRQDIHTQTRVVAGAGKDPYRQYYETGILEGLLRQVERLDQSASDTVDS